MTAAPSPAPHPGWTLVVHGGAGILPRGQLTAEQDATARAGLNAALDAGQAVLAAGGHALDAVEAAVRVLEDDPAFNAGRGAVFTYEGTQELDAAIMDGRTRAAGAVAGVTATKNPVTLARRVMEASPHVLLTGTGADAFSRDQGVEQADPGWFALPERREQLARMKADSATGFDVDMKYGTVGAVACDTHGHVAAATSTGGVTGKRWGRVGDSPLIGAGTYADDRAGAVSATGSGEFFIREGVAHEICARVRFLGETLQAAGDHVMADVRAMGGTGGIILAGPHGDIAWSLTTPGMYRARASATGERLVAIYGDEG
ncbi:asparaginase [Sphingomonas sp. Leaf33]|uniref:isoaspartyl peptidase/L-asparaginase family protein n=1 Tax=Sphingomonas sp. Leaf33 TaxID=1736215 RepID=UPI0006FAE3BF|nr:isoaspartyl peptidase/L-asparaginase [Sphingomonas sp. Leaf33]KQN25365.1 asparaginase [Sphingomonas sp. Leaf33]